jgi:transposase InsO family protein
VREWAEEYPVRELCAAVQISRVSYYRSLKAKAERDREWAEAVGEVFWAHRRRYGSRRIKAELQGQERLVGRHRIRRIMREQGWRALQPRSFVPRTTQSRHYLGFSPNLLKDRAFPQAPNEVWVGDITYLPLQSGKWAYLAAWIDLFSRQVVGWAVAGTMGEGLVVKALTQALRRRRGAAGAILHSDRGGQYAGKQFRRVLQREGLRQSMSEAGESYDNAFAESLFSRLKAELVQDQRFASVEAAYLETFNYLEGYYNRVRRHSSLGYVSPQQYERNFAAGVITPTAKTTRLIIDSDARKGLKAKTHPCNTF